MQTLITIAVFLLIFSFLIIIHELGHFLAAKKAGVKVYEFGVGMPPRIWGKKFKDTIYSINWIPFGGFVRMLGIEDPTSSQAKKSKESFLKKSLRWRILIASGGVLMNLILAFLLLTFGFWIGIEPLIITSDDFFEGVKEGQVLTEPGFYVYDVEEWSTAHLAGFQVGDRIISKDGNKLTEFEDFYTLADGDAMLFQVEKFSGETDYIEVLMTDDDLGLDLYLFDMPRVFVQDVEYGSDFYDVGLRDGDVILKVSGEEIFFFEEMREAFEAVESIDLQVWRNGEVVFLEGEKDFLNKAIISDVVAGSPAEEAGLLAGDRVISINGEWISRPSEIYELTTSSQDNVLRYIVLRNGGRYAYDVMRGEDGLVGIYVANLNLYDEASISAYEGVLTTSVLEILPERHGVFGAPAAAVGEIRRLSVMTALMAKDLVGGIVTSGEVSDSVAGPVGIAQMTSVFVQEGFASVIRFLALLSLALGVFNILPFPALDGGRLVFLLFEAVTGRKPNQKLETALHSIGFILLMMLIVVVTYNDIVRLVS
ncbi:MAG: RIP metalloprotease RseP [Patescibacteria group bacterium]